MTDKKPKLQPDEDPRAVSDHQVREEHSAEEIQKWRDEAQAHHQRWMEVMKNRYGKD